MTIDTSLWRVSGSGLNGGSSHEVLQIKITAYCTPTQSCKLSPTISVFVTTSCCKEIVSEAIINENGDGTYTCEYYPPRKRGNYTLHIEIDDSPACGSPYPIFFKLNELQTTSFEPTQTVCKPVQCNKPSVQAACVYQQPSLGNNSIILQAQTAIQAMLSTAHVESTCVKAMNVSQLITRDKLRDLFSLCGELVSLELRKEGQTIYALANFRSLEEASKSLSLTGMQLGDRILKVVKWIDPERLASNIFFKNQFTNLISTPKTEKASSRETLEQSNITTDQWTKKWREKQIQNYDMMERYAAFVAASRFQNVDPKKLLINQR